MSKTENDWNENFRATPLPRYIVAYKEAGDRLVQDIQRDQSFQHELALPIAFLYHHYLELGLKHLIFIGNQLLSNPSEWKQGFPAGHNLNDLLTDCVRILKQAGSEHNKTRVTIK
jgi:hypothetical protein